MKIYLSEVRKMVEEKFREGKPDEIRAELRRLRKKYKPEKEGLLEAKKIVKLVETKLQDDFILRFTEDFFEKQYDDLSDKFDKGVLESVRRAMKSGNSTEMATKLVKRLGNTNEHYLGTVVQTAKAGISQALKNEDASKAGIKYFRYEGPIGGSRAFCTARVGKVFSREEIEAMEGQSGLPVLYFGGGWNCRHRWVAVVPGLLKVESGVKMTEEEKRAAAVLVNNGHNVKWLKPSNKEKSHDAYVDDIKAEIKTLTESSEGKNVAENIRRKIRESVEQKADWCVLNVEKATDVENINYGLRRFFARSAKAIEKISLIYSGTLQTIKFDEIKNGKSLFK